MKILHVIADLNPASGGPPRVATRLAAAQHKLGHEVTIATYDSPGAEDHIRQMVAPLPGFDKVKTCYIPSGGVVEWALARRARPLLAELVRYHDVLHLHGLWESHLRKVASTAVRENRPYFIQPNGMLDPWSMAQKKWKKRVAMVLAYRQMLNKAAGLCLGNREESRLVELLGLKAEHFIAPMNSIFPEEVAELPAAGAFFSRYPQLKSRAFVLFLGRFHYKKGLDILAEAFAIFARRNREIDLVMIGSDGGAEADFNARIARHGLGSRVHFVGAQHGIGKWEALKDAACFVLPSSQEGFSVAIIEALACGVPVVITKGCHFPEVAEVGGGEVVDLSADAVADGLTRVLSSEAHRRQMGWAAKHLISQRFSSYKMAEIVIRGYQNALDAAIERDAPNHLVRRVAI